MQLKTYQENAIDELVNDSQKLLKQSGPKKLVFKAPTGSGKTVMVAEFMKQLVDDPEVGTALAFIWVAPRMLHEQSKTKLEQYFADTRALECSFFEDLDDRQIGESEVLFFNWESVRQENNVYIRENEQDNNLSVVLERTRDAGREVILVIDESHYHASPNTLDIIHMIDPKLTIEVSATPLISDPDEIVTVPLEDVKMEGMIKKSITLNPGFENVVRGERIKTKLAQSTDEIVLREAIQRREELVRKYRKAGIRVNPLMLIQLPDRRVQADEDLRTRIEGILKEKYGITVDNGKLAVYLSENKENLENLTRNDNEAEVLIFKQAIALGWDCPRAQVLALFREWASPVFSIQTVGRIMRMPEPDVGHYEDDLLNHAYVYTNLDDIEVKEDIGRGVVTIYTSNRVKGYKPVRLVSVYRKRHREKSRLSPLFIELFLKEAQNYGLKARIKAKGQKVQPAFISNYEADNVDTLAHERIKARVHLNTASATDLQRLFDYFVRKRLSPFYPEDRSIGRVKESIYRFFTAKMGMRPTERFEDIINIILSEKNIEHFTSVIEITKEHYIAETAKREPELTTVPEWEVPETLPFSSDYVPWEVRKSALQPFYYDSRWRTEKAFIEFLERSQNNILWWFKNGDRDSTFFAVPYEMNGEQVPFYVDFIVMLKDGRLGLLDTKSGRTIEDAKEKSDGLQEYIRRESKKRKMFGGLVANTDRTNYEGSWLYYDGSGKDLASGNFSKWKILEL